MPMNASLLIRATNLVRLATTIRWGLETDERTIPAINEHSPTWQRSGSPISRSEDP